MADVYALLQDDGALLYARPRGNRWEVSERRPDVGAHGRKLCVFVPGEDVLGLQAVIPARNENEARKAAPFLVEDEVAEPVESLHVALGPQSDAGAPRVLQVVSNDLMAGWVERLKQAGLAEASLVAAHSILPSENRLYSAAGMVLGRVEGRTFALDEAIGTDVFIGLENGAALPVYGEALAQRMGRAAAGKGLGSREVLLTQLAIWAGQTSLIDLRQGKFSPRRALDLGGLKRWRLAGGIAAAWAVVSIASIFGETMALNTRAAELDARAVEFVRAGWPEANGDVDTVARSIGPLQSTATAPVPSALTMMAALYGAIESVEGSELRGLRYDRARREMSARVAFGDYADIDRLVAAIRNSGLAVEAGDARQSSGKIVGELSLEPAS